MISIYIAIVVDFILGDPYWFPHPVRMIGLYVSFFEKIVRNFRLKDRVLKLLGVILTLSTVILTFGIVFFSLKGAKHINMWIYHALNVIMLWTTIAPRCLQWEAMKIYKKLKEGNLPSARKQVSYIVGRDTDKLNESEITRAVVETVGENTSDGVIAPLIYMFIGGAPLAMVYKAINTLDSMVGYKEDIYLNFGWFSAKLDDMVNYIPARLTAIFMILASQILRLNYRNCVKIIKRDRKNHTSPNAGYPEAAMAGALEIQLGGVNSYFGKPVYKPTIGDKLKILDKEDIKTSTKLMYTTTWMTLVVCSVVWILFKYIA